MKSYHRTCKTVLSPGADGAKKKGGWGVPYVTSRTIVIIVTGTQKSSVFLRYWIWSWLVSCGNMCYNAIAKSLCSNDLQSLTHSPI